jgi:DNA-damage-inducible protein J
MAKSVMIHARIEPKVKQDVEKIFSKLGLTPSEAIQLYFRQIVIHRGLPFEIKIPDKKIRKTNDK